MSAWPCPAGTAVRAHPDVRAAWAVSRLEGMESAWPWTASRKTWLPETMPHRGQVVLAHAPPLPPAHPPLPGAGTSAWAEGVPNHHCRSYGTENNTQRDRE